MRAKQYKKLIELIEKDNLWLLNEDLLSDEHIEILHKLGKVEKYTSVGGTLIIAKMFLNKLTYYIYDYHYNKIKLRGMLD